MSQNKNSAKFAFFYLLSLVALIFMSLSTGMIIFQIINKHITDIINEYSGSYSPEALKFAISALIISTPIYYLTSKQIYNNLFSGELDKDSGVRKWLTYFILLISSVVMIGWLIATLNIFLDGELTSKFFLKAITALTIATGISTFYFHDIKREEVAGKKDKTIKLYFYGSLIFIITAFVASLFTVESPTETRNRKLDNIILSNFGRLDNIINEYKQENGKLPNNLDELLNEINYISEKDLKEKATGTKYDYKIINDSKYELCATFRTSNKADDQNRNKFLYMVNSLHDSGYQCISNKTLSEQLKVKRAIPEMIPVEPIKPSDIKPSI